VKVKVLLFARLRELVGGEAVELELPEGATVGEIWGTLQDRAPALRAYPGPPLMAVDQDYARPETVVSDGEEVAFFPPVSGG